MKKAIIMGASSGMGLEIARLLLEEGWKLGLAARRKDSIQDLKNVYPKQVVPAVIDITEKGADEKLLRLIEELGDIDLYLHVAGIGYQNYDLSADKELSTISTNSLGFARMTGAAYRYFSRQGHGQIAAISSIAGTKGLGAAPAYSATKAFQSCYLQALEQQANMRKLNIRFTDIRPGFVSTALLNDGRHYPMLMDPKKVAKSIVEAIKSKRHVTVIDSRYRLLTFFWRWIPNWLWRHLRIRTE